MSTRLDSSSETPELSGLDYIADLEDLVEVYEDISFYCAEDPDLARKAVGRDFYELAKGSYGFDTAVEMEELLEEERYGEVIEMLDQRDSSIGNERLENTLLISEPILEESLGYAGEVNSELYRPRA